ncbi:MAG: nucleotidyl transferase AbiEii/AbiGii toxin family protein [Candidatus Omnitrophica bacterium]|nr:nucleotidyl transferase AbiEii/AbiGii toxin family protein [Candidatus Omnitrophota bacterium]
MDKFVLLSDKDKRAYFEVAAADLNVMPQLIEKDFWVCWILRTLFSLPSSGSHLTFKGGTSLSKCYDVIRRFSEDVDISIERSFLSSQQAIEPKKQESNKENQRRLERLQLACQAKISGTLIPELKKSIAAILTDRKKWNLEIDSNDALKQTVLFTFPHALTNSMESYVKAAVKIEFGSRADHWPVENMAVTPYVANVSDDVTIEGASVRVLAAERTFWEKATILHMIYHYPEGKNVPPRMSRHYYDLFAMVDSFVYKKSLEKISLLKHVSDHKSLFFKANWAHYEEAKPGSLRLVPRDDQISQLKTDYRQMQQMFFEDPPSFESVLEKLKIAEDKISRVKQ